MKMVNGNGERDMKQISPKELSIFTIKKGLKEGIGVMILTKKYHVGEHSVILGNVTIDDKTEMKETEDVFEFLLMFERNEYQAFEPYGKIVKRNGFTLIETPVTIYKEDIMMAGIIPKK